jgi:hypothetical protein
VNGGTGSKKQPKNVSKQGSGMKVVNVVVVGIGITTTIATTYYPAKLTLPFLPRHRLPNVPIDDVSKSGYWKS